jgi:hypothetical protein
MFRFAAAPQLCFASLIAILVAAPAFSQSATPVTAQAGPQLRVFDPSLIDTTVDPCENFYRFSCNNWFKRNPLPADQEGYGRFTELYELNLLHLKEILEVSAEPTPARTPNEQKIGDEYASCMDTAEVNRLGLRPLEPELERIAALESTAELPALLAHLQSIGVGAFFGPGLCKFKRCDQHLRFGRTGIAGARLLHADRSGFSQTAAAVCGSREQDACAGGRAGCAGRARCGNGAGD